MRVPLIRILLELLVTKILKGDTLCSLCGKQKYALAIECAYSSSSCEIVLHDGTSFPGGTPLTHCLHIFKEEDPGKTYLVLREKMSRADA